MKATELQIGDWVSWNGNQLKVKGTGEEDTYFGLDAVSDIIPNSELSPIPLTEEILKVNATSSYLGRYLIGTAVVFKQGDEIHFAYMKNKANIVGIMINYVHELQHALRICGLNELADNFNIT